MCDYALLKVDRAAKHVAELNKLFSEHPPFTYIVKTNTETRERATLAKKNKAIIHDASLITGDAVHNLRSALDLVYWEIVSPFANTNAERKKIQFPFTETAARLDEAIKNTLADRVSPAFFQTLVNLKPYGEPGGNELLYLIHELDVIDKHRLLIPMSDYKRLTDNIIRPQVPDFPSGIRDCAAGANLVDVSWTLGSLQGIDLGTIQAPTTHIFEKELNVPVDIVFSVRSDAPHRPIIPTIDQLCDVTKTTIAAIRNV